MTNIFQSNSAPSPLNPVVYVCLLSQYTVATAQAIKAIRPEQVIAISSKKMEQAGVDKRFSDLICSWGLSVEIVGNSLSAQPFNPDTLEGSAAWMKQHLAPMLQKMKRPGLLMFANLTGSTKAASIALDKVWKWDERHYTSEGTRNMVNAVGHPSGNTLFSLPCLELLEEAELLLDEVKVRSDPWEDVDHTLIRDAAQIIYEDYLCGMDNSVLYRHDDILHALWFEEDKKERRKVLTEKKIAFSKQYAHIPFGDLYNFLLKFKSIDPKAIQEVDGMLRIPASSGHRLSRFVTGTWWEILAMEWFHAENLDTLTNVEIVREETRTPDAETDILVRSASGEMLVVECKAALFTAKGSTDTVKILNDLSSRFGKSRGILAISPAFWWNFKDDQKTHLEKACASRQIAILDSKEGLDKWTHSKEAKKPPYELSLPKGRPAEEILAEGRPLVGVWQEDKRKRFEELRLEFAETYPNREEFSRLVVQDNLVRYLLDAAYKSGFGHPGAKPISELRQQARKLKIPRIIDSMEQKHEKGLAAAKRNRADRKAKASGKPVSTVKPRPNKAAPTSLPAPQPPKHPLPEPPQGLHPNDIRALEPASDWTLLLDEAGETFSGLPTGKKNEGKFVGLLVNTRNPGLPPLPQGWHAVDCTTSQEVDQVVQNVLNAPCGIIGLPLAALPETQGEMWLDGMLAVVDWVLRLLPIKGTTTIRVAIEGRPPFIPKMEAKAVARDALHRLGRAWPERAQNIDLDITTIGKNDHYLNGYVDSLAFTWGSPAIASRERLKRSNLVATCFLNVDSRAMAGFWDVWDRPGGISPTEWSELVTSEDARRPESIVSTLLFNLAMACVKTPSRLEPYMEETRRHLSSKAINLSKVSRQIEWLQAVVQNTAALPPAMRLIWLTAQLAQANHMGAVEATWMQEMDELRAKLREEDAPLVCHADLHRAVNATNRFDFAAAQDILKQWEACDPAVPGLRFWAQVQSSLGQVQAFLGNGQEATPFFDRAMEGFSRLSEPDAGNRERSQTLCYKLVAAMDTSAIPDDEIETLLQEYLKLMGLPEAPAEAADLLAGNTENSHKYTHHVLLRWLVQRGNGTTRATYLKRQNEWDTGHGHPWPLIQLYRAMLLHENDPAKATELAMDGASLAFMADQGPTVTLIGSCCRAVAASWGEPWREAQEMLAGLREALPLATDRIETLNAWLEKPDTPPMQMIKEMLPFNFR